MADVFNWGILGPGRIAHKFATDLVGMPDARLLAIGSRDAGRARAFADEFGAERAYGSYNELVTDPDVQAIYIATPNTAHLEAARLCLEHGKPVLCEKPFTANLPQARSLVEVSRSRGVFAMEAMWTRFIPVIVQVRNWLAEGRIGEPRLLTADFGFRAQMNPQHRLFAPALAGGGLLDVGVYVVSLAHMIFGTPETVQALGDVGDTGVDEQAVLALRFPGGALAALTCAIRTNTSHLAIIDGTEGRITIPAFWHATEATLQPSGGEAIVTRGESGYQFEAAEVMACMSEGRHESDIMSLGESLEVMATLDEARRQMGVIYPFEV